MSFKLHLISPTFHTSVKRKKKTSQFLIEPRDEIFNTVLCATSKASVNQQSAKLQLSLRIPAV